VLPDIAMKAIHRIKRQLKATGIPDPGETGLIVNAAPRSFISLRQVRDLATYRASRKLACPDRGVLRFEAACGYQTRGREKLRSGRRA